ncbi:hypothetical protein EGW08_002307 [Elysia chlorotica]|uniref:C2H2-type domain-containing protein n=1 Tax=Elysia chlorotica TaxID=188477 RepID=A0A3S1BRY3_ELYCH|nr:hypothetical protein EGW08_002307 [Elysia chlorotica]
MNMHPDRTFTGQVPDWILAPVYQERLTSALPLWRSLHRPEISLSLPTVPLHLPAPTLQTLLDLGIQKSQHYQHARQGLGDLPFSVNVVKPKAVRLYDIHIGVDSRLPLSHPGAGFDFPMVRTGYPSTALPPCLPVPPGYTGDKEASVKQVPGSLAGNLLASFSPVHGPALNSATRRANNEKHLGPYCHCYERNCPDPGRSSSKITTTARDLFPLCKGLPAQPQFPVFEPPVFAPRRHFVPDDTRCVGTQDITGQGPGGVTATRTKDHRWGKGAGVHVRSDELDSGKDRFFSLTPPLPSVYGKWNNTQPPNQQTPQPRDSPVKICNQKVAGDTRSGPFSQLVERGNPHVFNLGGSPPISESQVHFPHFCKSFLKDGISRDDDFAFECQIKKDASENCFSVVHAGTKTYQPNNFTDRRKMAKAKRSRKSAILFNRHFKSTDATTFLKRPNKQNENSRSRKARNKVTCVTTDSLEDLECKQLSIKADTRLTSNHKHPRRARTRAPSESVFPSPGLGPVSAHPGERKLFQCPHCLYVTDRKNNLKRHVVTMHHTSSKTLECCGLAFHSKAALREHNSVFHKGGYRCSLCARNFCRKALLRRHLAVHSGRKDFYCEQCGYATSHKSNLERHQKVHGKRGERPGETQETSDTSVPVQHLYGQEPWGEGRELLDPPVSRGLHGRRLNPCDLSHKLLCPNTNQTSTKYNESDKQKEESYVSPDRASCQHCCTETTKRGNSRPRAGNSLDAPKLSTQLGNSRRSSVHRARRSRGLLLKRIQDTYMGRNHHSFKPGKRYCSYQHSTCISDGEAECKQSLETDSRNDCDASSTSVDNMQKVDACYKPKSGSYAFLNKEMNQGDENHHRIGLEGGKLRESLASSNQSPDHDRKIPEELRGESELVGKTFERRLPPVLVSEETRPAVKRCKQASRWRLCQVRYPCRECGQTFPTQFQLGQHECLVSGTKTSPFNFSLVTAYHKHSAKD